MGNAIVLNQPQLSEFKYQLRILYFRLKANNAMENEIRTLILRFYGFPDKLIKPKIVISLTGAMNSVKIESQEILYQRIKMLYETEGLTEHDIELRLQHFHNFLQTVVDKVEASSPLSSIDSKDITKDSSEYGESPLQIIHSASFEESAEEAYVRREDEKRLKTMRGRVVAVEVVNYLKKGLKTSPVFTSPPSRRRSSVSSNGSNPDSVQASKTPSSSNTTRTPNSSNVAAPAGFLPAISASSDSKSSTSSTPLKTPLSRPSTGGQNRRGSSDASTVSRLGSADTPLSRLQSAVFSGRVAALAAVEFANWMHVLECEL